MAKVTYEVTFLRSRTPLSCYSAIQPALLPLPPNYPAKASTVTAASQIRRVSAEVSHAATT